MEEKQNTEFTCPKCGRKFNKKGWFERHTASCVGGVQANPTTAGATAAAPTFGASGTVPVGTRLLLNGKAWWWDQNPTNPGWKAALAQDRHVVVETRESQPTGMFLVCGANDSAVKWTFPESECFGGIAKIFDLSPVIPPPPVSAEPVETPKPVEEPKVEPPKEAKLEALIQESAAQAEELIVEPIVPQAPPEPPPQPKDEALENYMDAAEKYVQANEAKLAAEKVFKKVSANTRETIEDFVRARGTESAPGKEDFLVEEGGFKGWLVRTPGQERVERDETGILQWAIASGNVGILKTVVNIEAWNELKEKGFVPQEVIAKFEKPVKDEDRFALKISRLELKK